MIRTIITGIQPTGNLHLGNYLGAIRNFVDIQNDLRFGEQAFIFIADLHAMTVDYVPADLRRQTLELAAMLMACGVTQRSCLFNQGAVRHHGDLAYLLSTVARYGDLNRMVQFKEKSGEQRDSVSVALYSYPVLQAADVLLYGGTHVPVGEDQRQHIQLMRRVAEDFNRRTGTATFIAPEPLLTETARVMNLEDGGAKMSKSHPDDMTRINLTDDDDAIAKKLRRAKTDSMMIPDTVAELEGRPEAINLLSIYAAMVKTTLECAVMEFSGQGFGALKKRLTEVTTETLRPIRHDYRHLIADEDEIVRRLRMNGEIASMACEQRVNDAYRAAGIRR